MDNKYLTGTTYLAVTGPEMENSACRDSIELIQGREGDERVSARGTKGYESRQSHLNKFMASKHSFILFLDSDMIFPPDTLEKLRSHGLPYVSGLYMRRRFNPMAPIWFEDFEKAEPAALPLTPWMSVTEPDTLYKIGASGWGCVLVHRDVIEAVQGVLKGEDAIIEDDMDLYPYDLKKIMGILNMDWSDHSVALQAQGWLKQEIRPLRVRKDVVGSDIRFPFYAKMAGFQLYGDSGVACGHHLNYFLQPADFAGDAAANKDTYKQLADSLNETGNAERNEILAAHAEMAGQNA